jgi:hypothetical protein
MYSGAIDGRPESALLHFQKAFDLEEKLKERLAH